MRRLSRGILCLALFVPVIAEAAAGQVLFALGRVEIQRGDQTVAVQRGAPVEVGDTISTGPTGLAQLRMQDGALLSLRHGSSMTVEEYRMPVAAAAAPATGPVAGLAEAGGRSALRLLRGAFRTVTGLIGKDRGDSYRVATPVATIGIRGTDYSAAYCSGDCGSTADGLYLGVSNGGIDVQNDAGELVLSNDQYGYVKDGATPPARELTPPAVLDAPIPPEGEAEGGDGGPAGDLREVTGDRLFAAGDTQPEGAYEPRLIRGRYAYASNGFKGAAAGPLQVDGAGALLGFTGVTGASIGTAANFDVGGDSGLQWGRGHDGTANVITSDVPSPLDLTSASLHWIYASGADAAALPITGSRNYTLVGGTSPTDNNGNVGVLGTGTLFADFTALTVSNTINLTFNSPTGGTTAWQASGQGAIVAGAGFQGVYSAVFINGQTGGGGGFSGFFTGDAGAAGVVFELNDANFTTIVDGAAGFVETTSPAGAP